MGMTLATAQTAKPLNFLQFLISRLPWRHSAYDK
jgi:hypothetical protein